MGKPAADNRLYGKALISAGICFKPENPAVEKCADCAIGVMVERDHAVFALNIAAVEVVHVHAAVWSERVPLLPGCRCASLDAIEP